MRIRRYQKKFKKIERPLPKALIIAAMVVAVFAVYVITNLSTTAGRETIMGRATLPVVYTPKAGEKLNPLFGYTEKMEPQYTRDLIALVNKDYTLDILIEEGSEKVSSISYKLLELSDSLIIDEGAVSEFTSEEGVIKAALGFDNIMKDGSEYCLELNLSTGTGSAYYYVRVVKDAGINLKDQINFVKRFNKMTFDKENAADLFKYLETDVVPVDRNNLGKVNIYNHYYQVAWSDLAPEVITEPVIGVKELDGNIGCYTLEYRIATNVNGVEETYNVKEFYRVRVMEDGKEYLMYFDRSTDQIFDGNRANIYNYSLLLGLSSKLSAEYKASSDGSKLCFVNNASLWQVDLTLDEINKIFTFESEASDIRAENDSHNIRILSVEENGDVNYLVYGYMNRGSFEGKVGIAVVKYDNASKENNIIGFIRTTQSYEVLSTIIGDISYLNSENQLFLLIDDTLYSIDLSTGDSSLLVSGLVEGNYTTSPNRRMVAWHEDGSLWYTGQVCVKNLETGEYYKIDAPEGKKISAEGFVGDNLVYGIGEKLHKIRDAYGDVIKASLLKTDIVFANAESDSLLSQSSGKYFFTFVTTDASRAIMSRVDARGEDYNELIVYDVETESDAPKAASTYVETDETKRKQLILEFAEGNKISTTVTRSETEKTVISAADSISMSNLISERERYIVYALGQIDSVYYTAGDAINRAYALEGSVVDRHGQYVWQRRTRPVSVTISDAICKEFYKAYKASALTEIKDVKLSEMQYYLGLRKPVAAKLEGRTYILSGYNAQNYLLFDAGEGKSHYVPSDDVQRMLEGCIFYVE